MHAFFYCFYNIILTYLHMHAFVINLNFILIDIGYINRATAIANPTVHKITITSLLRSCDLRLRLNFEQIIILILTKQ